MNIIELTRQLGAAIQADERYLRFTAMREACDADVALQAELDQLREIQAAYRQEAEKPEPDAAQMAVCEGDFNQIYARILENPRMRVFEAARGEIDALLREINGILALCAQGADPTTCEPEQNCGGDCGGCAGCS